MSTSSPRSAADGSSGEGAGGLGPGAAAAELELVRAILDRTRRRLDPHAFHFVGWGAVVLVWYPLENLFRLQDRPGWWSGAVMAASLLAGILFGLVGEWRLARSGAAKSEDTVFSRQVDLVVAGTIGPAVLLSIAGPATGAISGSAIPLVWGFAYAVLAYSMGVIYSREYLWSGVAIFVAATAALVTPQWAGFILGPAMGLGLLVPGLISERRVRLRRGADADARTA